MNSKVDILFFFDGIKLEKKVPPSAPAIMEILLHWELAPLGFSIVQSFGHFIQKKMQVLIGHLLGFLATFIMKWKRKFDISFVKNLIFFFYAGRICCLWLKLIPRNMLRWGFWGIKPMDWITIFRVLMLPQLALSTSQACVITIHRNFIWHYKLASGKLTNAAGEAFLGNLANFDQETPNCSYATLLIVSEQVLDYISRFVFYKPIILILCSMDNTSSPSELLSYRLQLDALSFSDRRTSCEDTVQSLLLLAPVIEIIQDTEECFLIPVSSIHSMI